MKTEYHKRSHIKHARFVLQIHLLVSTFKRQQSNMIWWN